MGNRRPPIVVMLLGLLLVLDARAASAQRASDLFLSWTQATELLTDRNSSLTTLNTLLMPMGGNVEGMGTAYTAVADDSSYIEANAAASSRLTYTELAFSHRSVISDVYLDTVVYTIRLKNLGLGVAGKFVPIDLESYDDAGNELADGYVAESVLILNGSYNILSSYLFDGIALGGNLKVAARFVDDRLLDPGYDSQTAWGFMADLGVLTRLNLLKPYVSRAKNFSVGAALKNLGPNALGEPLPTVFSVGVAYSFIRPLLVSADFNVPIMLDPAFPANRVNGALGVDLQIADFLSLHGGVWVRDNPRFSLGGSAELRTMSVTVNAVLDLTKGSSLTGLFSVQARLKLGDRDRAKQQAEIDGLFADAYEAFANGSLETAREKAEEVLKLQPGHLHAQRLVQLVVESLDTQRRIREKQEEAAGLLRTTPEGETGPTEILPPADEGLEN